MRLSGTAFCHTVIKKNNLNLKEESDAKSSLLEHSVRQQTQQYTLPNHAWMSSLPWYVSLTLGFWPHGLVFLTMISLETSIDWCLIHDNNGTMAFIWDYIGIFYFALLLLVNNNNITSNKPLAAIFQNRLWMKQWFRHESVIEYDTIIGPGR